MSYKLGPSYIQDILLMSEPTDELQEIIMQLLCSCTEKARK